MNVLEARRKWEVRGAGLLLYALLLAAFLPAVTCDFCNFDDDLYITKNPHVQQGLTPESVVWAFTNTTYVFNWHPLTWLSHLLDCQWFGMRAWGHHLTSVLLHALNGVLLFAALRRLTGALWRSFIVALLFGLHPQRVETVAWIAARQDLLGATFWMLTLWAYARAAELEAAARGQGSAARLPLGRQPSFYRRLSLACLSLGLMCKPMLVTIPCVLLLLDYWPLGRWRPGAVRALVVEKVPFFVAALLVSGLTCLIRWLHQVITPTAPLADRVSNAAVAYCRYLGKLFWPVHLSVFYPPERWALATEVVAAGLLAVLTAGAFLLRTRRPYFLVGWLWFVGTLVPVIGLVPAGDQSMADRYSYIPCIGILLALVWGVQELSRRWRFQAGGAAAAVAAAALLCFCQTRAQLTYWKTSETLFRHAVSVTRNNYLAHNNLGMTLAEHGRVAEAKPQYEAALQEKPAYPMAHLNLAAALAAMGRPADAAAHLLEALRLQPDYPEAHCNLAILLQQQGRLEEAVHEYETALRHNFSSADAEYNLGVALVSLGRLGEAIPHLAEALRLQPGMADARISLGIALGKTGQNEPAIAQFQEAVRLKPDEPRGHFYLGLALSRKGQLDAAIAEFSRTLQLKPGHPEARTNLAILLSIKQGRK